MLLAANDLQLSCKGRTRLARTSAFMSQVVVSLHLALQKFEALARRLRQQKALQERKSMQAHIAASYDLHRHRQEGHGDGFFVVAALFGDARTLVSLQPRLAGGQPVNVRTLVQDYPLLIDVTGALQGMVEVVERDATSESAVVQLVLPAHSKTAIDGVWDPTSGGEKKLWVRYEFIGYVHEALIDDEAPLKCPVKRKFEVVWHGLSTAGVPV